MSLGDEVSRSDEPSRAERMKERLADRRESHLQRGRFYRIGFAIVGATVTLAGITMLVTPGPAFVVIPIGLAMLALEFAWAERWLERLVARAEQAVDQVTQGSPLRRAALLAAGALAVVAIVVMVVLWDIPFFPG